MIEEIEFQDFRRFKRFRVSSLNRVNLFVGKNGSGKTSILEGLQFVVSGGDPNVLMDAAVRRGETVGVGKARLEYSDPDYKPALYPSISHFFRSHEFRDGVSFRIEERGKGYFEVRKTSREDPAEHIEELVKDDYAFRPRLEIGWNDIRASPEDSEYLLFPVFNDGAMSPLLVARSRQIARLHEIYKIMPNYFLPIESLGFDEMASLLTAAIRSSNESEIVRALQFVDPRIAGIFVVTEEGQHTGDFSQSVIVDISGEPVRVPLGSLGGGVKHMLALGLGAIHASGGALFVDEIDTGLHFSALGEMWKFLLQCAGRFDLQVFSTTHSLDCLRGLAEVCESNPELGEQVTVHRLDPSLDHSVALDSENIMVAAEQDIEVR